MLNKNFLHSGPNEMDYYDNDPLHPEFVPLFAKTSYRTTVRKRALKIPENHKGQYTLTWRGPLHIATSMEAIQQLLQKHVDEYTEWVVLAFFILHHIKAYKYNDYSYNSYKNSGFKFDSFLDVLLYELIVQNELYIYSYNSDCYLPEIEYYGRGHFSNNNGLGLIYLVANGYEIAHKVQWSEIEM